MRFILLDPLNIKEWADLSSKADIGTMPVYFAFQTLAGAMMHLYVLGALMGLILGGLGGLASSILVRFIHKQNT